MEQILKHFKHGQCIYCRKGLDSKEWSSEWSSDQHYKQIKCRSCGKKNWSRLNFAGSGHDCLPEEESPLESTVKRVMTN